jgi:hypothetical protein
MRNRCLVLHSAIFIQLEEVIVKAVNTTTGQLINSAAVSILAPYVLTTIHHIYGGIVDRDLNRLYVPIIAAVPLLVTQGSLYLYKRTRSGAALATFSTMAVLGWVIASGLLHGGYAHAYKDILFLAGVGKQAAQKLYYPLNPNEHYPPDDIFFEVTGVLELVTAYFVAVSTLRLIRDSRKGNHEVSVQDPRVVI